MLPDELLDEAPGELPVQVEVEPYGDPELARATGAAVCRVACTRPDRGRVEVLSFHTIACEETARHGMPGAAHRVGRLHARRARTVGGARRVRGVWVEHFLLHPAVERLRLGGLSVTTGTVNDVALAASGCSRRRRDQHRSTGGLHHELVKMPRSA
jgi:hypothetical protein